MGLGGISIGSLLLILVIAALVFGTKRLGSIGEDVGKALKSFRKGLGEANQSDTEQDDAGKQDDTKNA